MPRSIVAVGSVLALTWAGLAQEGARAILVKPLQQGAPGRLEFSLDKGCGAVYQHRERVQVRVKSERDGHLTLFDFPPGGQPQIIFPNAYHTDNFIRGGVEYTIPGEVLPFEFVVAPPDGGEVLFAVVTSTKRISFLSRCTTSARCSPSFRVRQPRQRIESAAACPSSRPGSGGQRRSASSTWASRGQRPRGTASSWV